MEIKFTIIRNGISRGILEGTKVPEKPTPENFKSKDNWAFTFQSLWDASIEWEDQEAIAYRLPQYTAFERKPDKPKYFGLKDGIYPLEGVDAEKIYQSLTFDTPE